MYFTSADNYVPATRFIIIALTNTTSLNTTSPTITCSGRHDYHPGRHPPPDGGAQQEERAHPATDGQSSTNVVANGTTAMGG